jgi:hypothetical protein
LLNGRGEAVFVADLEGPNLPPTFYVPSTWYYDGQSTRLLVRDGTAVPGSEFFFRHVGGIGFNDAGQYVFSASAYDSPTRGTFQYHGIWMFNDGVMENVLRSGEAAPGLPGVRFDAMSPLALNGQGNIAFYASLTGDDVTDDNNGSLWKTTSNGLQLVAREGDVLPGTGLRFPGSAIAAYNSLGQLAFALQTGNVVRPSGHLWAQDVAGNFHRIAGDGMELEVAPGDVRIVQSVEFVAGSGLEDGQRVGLNELGQVAFTALFTDGSSGMFVSNLVAVPEPAWMAAQALLAAIIWGCRAGRRIRRPD